MAHSPLFEEVSILLDGEGDGYLRRGPRHADVAAGRLQIRFNREGELLDARRKGVLLHRHAAEVAARAIARMEGVRVAVEDQGPDRLCRLDPERKLAGRHRKSPDAERTAGGEVRRFVRTRA